MPRQSIVRKSVLFVSAISALLSSVLAGVVAAETIHESAPNIGISLSLRLETGAACYLTCIGVIVIRPVF